MTTGTIAERAPKSKPAETCPPTTTVRERIQAKLKGVPKTAAHLGNLQEQAACESVISELAAALRVVGPPGDPSFHEPTRARLTQHREKLVALKSELTRHEAAHRAAQAAAIAGEHKAITGRFRTLCQELGVATDELSELHVLARHLGQPFYGLNLAQAFRGTLRRIEELWRTGGR